MTSPRPRSVTLGCIYGGLGGLLTSLALIEALREWGSIEMQEALATSLEQVGADIDVAAALTPLRWAAMVVLVAAIAATVFAFYAAKGHQASRIGLTVLAALAGGTFALTGAAGLLPAVLAALIVYLLWSAPAREWFAVVNGRTPLSLGAEPTVSPTAPAPGVVAPHRQADPSPVAEAPVAQVPPAYDPTQYAQQGAAAVPARRPRAVTTALALSGVSAAVGAAVSGLMLLVLVVARDQIVEQYASNDMLAAQLDRAGVSADQMVTFASWLFAGWLVVSVLTLVAVGWAATGHSSGWVALLVATVILTLSGGLGLPLGLLWLVAGIIAIVQLCKPESRAWFRRT